MTTVKVRRKKARYHRRTREQMKIRRDEICLEYLRTVRDLAAEEMRRNGVHPEPLSVYSTDYFPLSFQFKEKPMRDGKVKVEYNRSYMPQWKDLTLRAKLEVFQLLCEEWPKRLYTFNPKVHPELEKELSGRDIVTIIRKRASARLEKLEPFSKHYFFVVEGHDRQGKKVPLHIHGMAVVEDESQAEEVKIAMGQAAGQDANGRKKLPSGNRGQFYYHEKEKSWSGYIIKNVGRSHPLLRDKNYVFSRPAVQITREFYEMITGQD